MAFNGSATESQCSAVTMCEWKFLFMESEKKRARKKVHHSKKKMIVKRMFAFYVIDECATKDLAKRPQKTV